MLIKAIKAAVHHCHCQNVSVVNFLLFIPSYLGSDHKFLIVHNNATSIDQNLVVKLQFKCPYD